MTRATRTAEYTGATTLCLYLAFELGSNEWKLGFTTEPGATPRVRTMPARDLARLTREIADATQWFGLKAATPVRSCYEAGRDGFWLHRYLTSLGIANVVVDSSSIEVNRRLRRAKSDALDVRKLLGMLLRYHAGEHNVWSVVRVPTVEQEDRRQLHRELRTLKQERTRVANRITGLLATQGIALPPGTDIGAAAKTVRLWDGSPVPAALRARVERDWEHAQFLRTRILELERERQRAIAHGRGETIDQVRQLLRLRAVGPTGAWVYVNEFFGWRRFRNRKEVGAAAGLTPTPYQSGDEHREQGISKAGSRHIRAVAIETAWCWLRYQPHSRLSRCNALGAMIASCRGALSAMSAGRSSESPDRFSRPRPCRRRGVFRPRRHSMARMRADRVTPDSARPWARSSRSTTCGRLPPQPPGRTRRRWTPEALVDRAANGRPAHVAPANVLVGHRALPAHPAGGLRGESVAALAAIHSGRQS